jgi:hypothetical protein
MKAPGTLSRRNDDASSDSSKNLILALVAVAGLLLISGLGYAGYKMIVIKPAPIVAAPPPPVVTAVPLSLEGVSVADPARADPTDILPSARKRVSDGSIDYKLLEISIVRGRAGVVNLTRTDSQISYAFLYEQNDPRLDKKDQARERVDLTLRGSAPVIERAKSQASDEPVQEPMCVWSAAWRAAVAAGFNQEAEFNARYGKRSKTDKAAWTLTAIDKPDDRLEIDAVSCAIRLKK